MGRSVARTSVRSTASISIAATRRRSARNPAAPCARGGPPSIATIPNPSFGLRIEDVAPSGSVAVLVSLLSGNTDLGNGCTLYLHTPSTFAVGSFGADGQGVAQMPFGVPNDASLEGAGLTFQAVELVPGGPLYGQLELSNAIRVRIGNQTTGCQ